MPQTLIQVFREASGAAPLEVWLDDLATATPDAHAKCLYALLELERLGSESRRPHSDVLRDGIRELRVRHKRVNYRMLYFFNGKDVVVVSHGCTKESQVPNAEIEKAIARRKFVQSNPSTHITEWKR